MNNCSFQTALEVWNEGFKGYFVDLTLSLDAFLKRLSSEGISPELSLIAFLDSEPVGFVLNAIRTRGNQKFAWNGGTGVVPAMRGKGIGKVLIDAALDLYAEESVDVAMLEAIRDNENAIALYKRCGYEIVDELTLLRTDEPISTFISPSMSSSYSVRLVHPAVVSSLSFYDELAPWQSQWQTVASSNGGAGLIVEDGNGRPAAYALLKKKFDDNGSIVSVGLCQCEVDLEFEQREAIAAIALQQVFLSDAGKAFQRITYNFRKSNTLVMNLLLSAGFSTHLEQVHMMKKFTRVR